MKKTVLVIDDNSTSLEAASNILSEDYLVAAANSGLQAQKYLERHTPDLILLDILMPEMDGFQFKRIINQEPAWSKIPVIFLTADEMPDVEVECFACGAVDYIKKPFQPQTMLSRIRRTLELETLRNNLAQEVTRKTMELAEKNHQFIQLQHQIIVSMANLIESRDGFTGEHVKRTSQYVELILQRMRRLGMYQDILTEDYIVNACNAAPLHDIGKILVPDSILKKPGKLTEEEFQKMQEHAIASVDILNSTIGSIESEEFLLIAKDISTYHHEKWNGSGYPFGLHGEGIPLIARVMAVADVFDALVSKRCYKEPMSLDLAFDVIRDSKTIHFDPAIADIFLSLRPEIEEILYDEYDQNH